MHSQDFYYVHSNFESHLNAGKRLFLQSFQIMRPQILDVSFSFFDSELNNLVYSDNLVPNSFMLNWLYNNFDHQSSLRKIQDYKQLVERVFYKNYYNLYASVSSALNVTMQSDFYTMVRQRAFKPVLGDFHYDYAYSDL